jgi:hypothetical protein
MLMAGWKTYQPRVMPPLPFEEWLTSDNAKLRETVRELVYVHGKYWCGSQMDEEAKKTTRRLMMRVRRLSGCPRYHFVKEAISILAQTHYGL